MKPCFYAKSPGNEGYIKNMEVLAFHGLDGWAIFQMALYRKEGRYYLYGAGRGNPVCPILDVTDPERPKLVERLCVAPDNPRQKVGRSRRGGRPAHHSPLLRRQRLRCRGGLPSGTIRNGPERLYDF